MVTKAHWDNQPLKSYFVALTKEQRIKVRATFGLNLKGDDDTKLELKASLEQVKALFEQAPEEVRATVEQPPKKAKRIKKTA